MSYRTLNRLVLAKVETVSGTDAAPTPAANAIMMEGPQSSINLGSTETREVTGALDRRAPIPNGGDRGFTGRVYCKGSGTPGTAPEADPLLKGASLGITTLGTAHTGTAAGAAASTITLAAGASAVDNAYRGMVIEITAGTGVGQKAIIVSYVGSTKVATVAPAWTTVPTGATYNIPICNVYSPISANLPNVTIYDYHLRGDGGQAKLKKTVGGAGNARFTLAPRSAAYWDFDYRGMLLADADVTAPATGVYQPTRPFAFMNAQVYLGNTRVRLNSLNVDLGATPVAEDDPNAQYGTTVAGVTERAIGGTMRLPKDLESVRNVFNSFLAGTKFNLTSIWGTTPGNRLALLLTDIVYTGVSDEDVQGFNYDSLPFRVDASDAGAFWCYW